MSILFRPHILVLALLATLLLGGCGGGESAYVGQWQLDKDATKVAMEKALAEEEDKQEGMEEFAKGMMNAMLESMVFEVELKKDHTFSAHMTMPMAGDESHTGTWELDGKQLVLHAEDEPDPGHMELKGGKLHFITDKNDPPLVLERKK